MASSSHDDSEATATSTSTASPAPTTEHSADYNEADSKSSARGERGAGSDEAQANSSGVESTRSIPPDWNDAAALLERGTAALLDGVYTEALECFKPSANLANAPPHSSLFFRVEQYGRHAPECVLAYYRYALTLIYKVPLASEDDRGGRAGPEAHSGSISGDIEGGDDSESLESAQVELELAFSILDMQKGPTMEKVEILSALGELGAKKSDFAFSVENFRIALSMLQKLVAPDNQKLAYLTTEDAIAWCEHAIGVSRKRQKQITTELGELNVTETNQAPTHMSTIDLYISKKQAELSVVNEALALFQAKLATLEWKLLGLQATSSSSSQSLEQSSADSTSRHSSKSASPQHRDDVLSPPASTAGTSKTDQSVNAQGTKRQLRMEPTSEEHTSKRYALEVSVEKRKGIEGASAESTPTKITPLDSMTGEHEEGGNAQSTPTKISHSDSGTGKGSGSGIEEGSPKATTHSEPRTGKGKGSGSKGEGSEESSPTKITPAVSGKGEEGAT
ncbi:uncharacterized protein LOC131162819 [Malania oleifera]|uniref:uncharacterized protein LOC131162819 n=1 Tax=Malania oleifera TaxID=397392 RepID=UPI0025AEC3A6|nr:uncharacterized protein LOC131162819 [Malania oleifera]